MSKKNKIGQDVLGKKTSVKAPKTTEPSFFEWEEKKKQKAKKEEEEKLPRKSTPAEKPHEEKLGQHGYDKIDSPKMEEESSETRESKKSDEEEDEEGGEE